MTILVVAALVMGATTTSGCGQDHTTDEAALGVTATVGAEGATATDSSDDVSPTGDGSPPAVDGTSQDGGSPESNDAILGALEAELAAMESELDALDFPDDDFSGIEELLD